MQNRVKLGCRDASRRRISATPPKIEAIYRYKQHFKISNLTHRFRFFFFPLPRGNNFHSPVQKNYLYQILIELWKRYNQQSIECICI